jgi:hypothetical protein
VLICDLRFAVVNGDLGAIVAPRVPNGDASELDPLPLSSDEDVSLLVTDEGDAGSGATSRSC